MRPAYSGRAKISIRRPQAIGECDRCGFWHTRADMPRQFQWSGNRLFDTGFVVGNDCLDVPQQQFRTPILPPDPRPIINPRIGKNITPVPAAFGFPLPVTPENQGFSQYQIGPATFIGGLPTRAGVLAELAVLSGIPTPLLTDLASYTVPLSPANTTVQLTPPNPLRTFLAIFNPTQLPAQFSLGTATLGAITNLSVGPNEAYFWSTSQGLAPVYQGPTTAIGVYAPLPLWAWEDGSNLVNLFNDGGVLALTNPDPNYPTAPNGLPPGAVWNNGGTIGVIPGITPNPNAPPVFFGAVTSSSLLVSGGGNLPLSNAPLLLNQLWNNGGEIAISPGTNVFTLGSSLLSGPDVLA